MNINHLTKVEASEIIGTEVLYSKTPRMIYTGDSVVIEGVGYRKPNDRHVARATTVADFDGYRSTSHSGVLVRFIGPGYREGRFAVVPLRQLWAVTRAAARRQYEAEQAEREGNDERLRAAHAAEVERGEALVTKLGVGAVDNRYSGTVYIRLTIDEAATLTNNITKENQPS